MTDQIATTPQDIIDVWFPDGPDPEPKRHLDLWVWRMRGGANDEILARYSDLTERAALGELDFWAATPLGRLALIIVVDQFPRTVWAGSAKAYAQDTKALGLCLEGLENGDFEALENVWYKAAFKMPLEHCECPDHLVNLDRAILIADQLAREVPETLKDSYAVGARQPRLHRPSSRDSDAIRTAMKFWGGYQRQRNWSTLPRVSSRTRPTCVPCQSENGRPSGRPFRVQTCSATPSGTLAPVMKATASDIE